MKNWFLSLVFLLFVVGFLSSCDKMEQSLSNLFPTPTPDLNRLAIKEVAHWYNQVNKINGTVDEHDDADQVFAKCNKMEGDFAEMAKALNEISGITDNDLEEVRDNLRCYATKMEEALAQLPNDSAEAVFADGISLLREVLGLGNPLDQMSERMDGKKELAKQCFEKAKNSPVWERYGYK